MKKLIAVLLVSGTSAFLTACQTPLVDETGPLSIRSVAVSTAPAASQAAHLIAPIQTVATTKLAGASATGTPANVSILIEGLTYKNAAMSLLVGSANQLSTKVTVSDQAGKVLASFPQVAVDNAAINGIIGAAMAATQDNAVVDQRMVESYSADLKTRIFGPEGHKPAKSAPLAAPAAAPAGVPTPAPKPPSNKGAPVS